MNRSQCSSASPGGRFFLTLVVLASLACIGIDGLLAWHHYSEGGTLAGCGPGGGCDEVARSKWSVYLGVPVAVLGIGTYVVLLGSVFTRRWRVFDLLLGAISAGVLWFVALQFFVIGRVCPWCMAGHVCGVVVVIAGCLYRLGQVGLWKRFMLALCASLALLAAGQIAYTPKTYRVEKIGQPTPPDDAPGTTYPHLGPDDAPETITEFFDYTCPACRTMSRYLEALQVHYPGKFRIDLRPVPMEKSCNPDAIETAGEQAGACEMAKWSLAVWRNAPEQFADFHAALLAMPSADNAQMLASAVISPDRLDAATSDPWIVNYIQANIADWKRYSSQYKKLPKLILSDRRLYHGIPDSEQSFLEGIAKEYQLDAPSRE